MLLVKPLVGVLNRREKARMANKRKRISPVTTCASMCIPLIVHSSHVQRTWIKKGRPVTEKKMPPVDAHHCASSTSKGRQHGPRQFWQPCRDCSHRQCRRSIGYHGGGRLDHTVSGETALRRVEQARPLQVSAGHVEGNSGHVGGQTRTSTLPAWSVRPATAETSHSG